MSKKKFEETGEKLIIFCVSELMVQEDDDDLRLSMSLRPTTLSTRPNSLSVNGNEKAVPEESVL